GHFAGPTGPQPVLQEGGVRGGDDRGEPDRLEPELESPALDAARQGRRAGAHDRPPRSKVEVSLSTIVRPITSAAVAAGDGTLRTWIIRPAGTIQKSSTRRPRRSTACARTPDPPGSRSFARRPGASRRRARRNALLLSDCHASRAPLLA